MTEANDGNIPRLNNKQVAENREKALAKIISLLDKKHIDYPIIDAPTNYWDKRKFLVTWNDNYGRHGIVEKSIDLCDSAYLAFSGYQAIFVVRNLFHEKQLDQFPTIEIALLKIGMCLAIGFNKERGQEFINKYVIPYNERIKHEAK